MLTTKSSAGVALEANLMESTLALKSMADITKSRKQGYKVATQKALMSSKNIF